MVFTVIPAQVETWEIEAWVLLQHTTHLARHGEGLLAVWEDELGREEHGP